MENHLEGVITPTKCRYLIVLRYVTVVTSVILASIELTLFAAPTPQKYCGVILFAAPQTEVTTSVTDDLARLMAVAVGSLTETVAVDPAEIRMMLPTDVSTTSGLPSLEVFRSLLDKKPFEILIVGQVSGSSRQLSLHIVRVADERLLDREWRITGIAGAHATVKELREIADKAAVPAPTVLVVEVQGKHTARIEVDGRFVADAKHHRLEVEEGVRVVRIIGPNGQESVQDTLCRRGRLCTAVFADSHPQTTTVINSTVPMSGATIAAWTMAGTAVIALGAGAGVGLHVRAIEHDLEQACPANQCTYTRSKVNDLTDEGNVAAMVTTTLFVVGAAAATTSLILFLLDPGDSTAAVNGVPIILPGGGTGVVTSVRF